MSKKLLCVFSVLIAVLYLLSACGATASSSANTSSSIDTTSASSTQSEPLNVVVTIFPIYDWVKEITNSTNINVTLLLDSGVDLHNYQPSATDIATILDSDLFIYNGGTSDIWVEDLFTQDNGSDVLSMNMMDLLGDSVHMEPEYDHDHVEEETHDDHDHVEEETHDDHDHVEEETHDDHDHESAVDEHIWLSLRNAVVFCQGIADKLSEINPANAEQYKQSSDDYINSLESLDAEYTKVIGAASQDTLVFGDRFPFVYLLEDYSLSHHAAFSGCSTESEASFETVAHLAGALDEIQTNYIFTIDGGNTDLAQTIIDSSQNQDREILGLHSLQSVNSDDITDGITYLSVMQENLQVLQTALS